MNIYAAGPLALMGTAALAAAAGMLGLQQRRRIVHRKPQRRFKRVLIDNTDAPFVHGTWDSTKHAEAGCDEQQHPYAAAIDRLLLELPMPSELQPWSTLPPSPAPLDATPLAWVADEAALRAMVRDLSREPRFALDVEHSPRAYHGITCLIQVSTGEMHACIQKTMQ